MGFVDEKLIPGVILLVFVFIMFNAFSKPFTKIKDWIVGLFSSGKNKAEEKGVTLYYE